MSDIQKYRPRIFPIANLQAISTLTRVLPAYEIQIFTLHLSEIRGELASLPRFLSCEERKRAESFHFDRDANLFIAAHGLLRVIVGHYLQVPPQDIFFTSQSRGKPMLSPYHHKNPISFNISHSWETAIIAVSATAEIGIDIETIRPFDNFMEIAEHYFHPQETQAIAAVSRSERLRKFYEIWTQKEAVVKALGTGLSLSLNSFHVSGGYPSWGKIHFSPCQNEKRLYSRQICRKEHYQGALSLNLPLL